MKLGRHHSAVTYFCFSLQAYSAWTVAHNCHSNPEFHQIHFRLHRQHAVHRCGITLQILHAAWSVCLCVGCNAQQLNRSRYGLGPHIPMLRIMCYMGVQVPHGKGQFWGNMSPVPLHDDSSIHGARRRNHYTTQQWLSSARSGQVHFLPRRVAEMWPIAQLLWTGASKPV